MYNDIRWRLSPHSPRSSPIPVNTIPEARGDTEPVQKLKHPKNINAKWGHVLKYKRGMNVIKDGA